MTATVGRKDFLRIFAVAGTGLALGVEFAPKTAAAATGADFSPVVWLRMHPSGMTTVIVNQSEMGQGITTALPMCLADELDIPMSTVSFEISPAEVPYYNAVWHGIATGGSRSTPSMSPVMRKAGATARAMLVSAAAQQWNVDPKACTTANGVVTGPAGQKAKYTDLLVAAAALPVPADVALKTPDKFRIIGTRQPRLDLKPKTNGRAIYGMDVHVPGMKYASVEKPVQIGATVASFDATDALKYPGVRQVVQISTGVAVIADNTWAAFKGRRLLKVKYNPGPNAGLTSAAISAKGRELVKTPGGVLRADGDPAALTQGTVVESLYEVPFLAHATMEPMNATADVRADHVTLWVPTQAQTDSQKTAAKIAGLPITSVTVNTTFLGGGFGRRGEQDFIVDAVETSKAAGVPIKCVYTREDDMRAAYYRSGHVNLMTAALSPNGKVTAFKTNSANVSIAKRALPFLIKNGVDQFGGNGLANTPYKIANYFVENHMYDYAIPVGFWRAPHANANTFIVESFIDELAHTAGTDPLAFRLAMIEPDSRPANVLARVAKAAKWGGPVPAGHAKGIALAHWDEGWIGMVSEISLVNKKVKVHKMWASVDVGQPINLDGLDQQIPSAMIYGLSAALYGKITFADGGAVQKNFNDYQVLHMADSPQFFIDIVPSTESPTGAGEIGTPAVAPSIANAVFTLTGKRVRSLPLSDALA